MRQRQKRRERREKKEEKKGEKRAEQAQGPKKKRGIQLRGKGESRGEAKERTGAKETGKREDGKRNGSWIFYQPNQYVCLPFVSLQSRKGIVR
jgi:hypothetical protein